MTGEHPSTAAASALYWWARRNLLGDNRDTVEAYAWEMDSLALQYADLQDQFRDLCQGSIAASDAMRVGLMQAMLDGRLSFHDEPVER